MRTVFEIVEPILLIFGSIALSALICWLLWRSFELLHHPDWAALAAVSAGVLALHATSPHQLFLRMVVGFTLAGAVPLWIEGRSWCRRRSKSMLEPVSGVSDDTPIRQADPSRRYPIITSCIGEARPPRQEEVRALAGRIWREGLQQRAALQSSASSFATRRFVFRAARTALSGHGEKRVACRRPGNDL
jgi:hypothetical protein